MAVKWERKQQQYLLGHGGPTLDRNGTNPPRLVPDAKADRLWGQRLLSDDLMVTPPSIAGSPVGPEVTTGVKNKRKASAEVETSASPALKQNRNGEINRRMQRTPQTNLTQTKITGCFGVSQTQPDLPPAPDTATAMDVAPHDMGAHGGQGAPVALGGQGEALTADFFRTLIGENTRQITGRIDGLSEDVLALTRSVALNRSEIGKHSEEIRKQADIIAEQRSLLDTLGGRVAALESGNLLRCAQGPNDAGPKTRSADYLLARRSIRMWPIDPSTQNTLWEGVGNFIPDVLRVADSEVSQHDIESIVALEDPRIPAGNLNREALVTFFCPRKRDMLMSGTPNLANWADSSGRPTAGLRLEIPKELDATFRLLSRFGTRLRARHGEGTKRHVKFDDYEASLFINIRLPGDEEWSRVSPAMAKADLDQSSRAETAGLLKRIAAGPRLPVGSGRLIGPRGRLAVPIPHATSEDRPGPSNTSGRPDAQGNGHQRPRPWAPRPSGPSL